MQALFGWIFGSFRLFYIWFESRVDAEVLEGMLLPGSYNHVQWVETIFIP